MPSFESSLRPESEPEGLKNEIKSIEEGLEYAKILKAKKVALEDLPAKLTSQKSVQKDIKRYDELIKRVTELVMSGDLPAASAEKSTDENNGKSTGATLAKISGAALGMFQNF